jgi:SET domain-containing protein
MKGDLSARVAHEGTTSVKSNFDVCQLRWRDLCMKKAKNTRYKLEIRESSIAGQRLFALEDIPWGKKIKEYAGKIISDKEAAKRSKEGATAIMVLEDGKNIDGFDGGNVVAYVNHSRENPNCFLLRHKGQGLVRRRCRGHQGW